MSEARVVVRGPNHLGDGVMARPAIAALARLGPVTVHAPAWRDAVYGDLDVVLRPARQVLQGDVAVLLAPSLRAAWEARRVPVRIGTPTDGRGRLLTVRVPPAPHTAGTYARLARAAGVEGVLPPPRLPAPEVPVDVPEGHVAIHPLSATGAVREWQGWSALATRLRGPVVFYGGPGEGERLAAVARGHAVRVGLPLPALGAALRRARLHLAADTGPAHLARAHGVPTLVLYGSTAPQGSGAHGAHALEGVADCRPCYGRTCRTGTLACLDLPLARVHAAVEALGG